MKRQRQNIVLDLTDADPENGALAVEAGVPVPKRYRELRSIYPFAIMKPSQSFFIPNPDHLRACRTLCQAVAMYKKRVPTDDSTFVVRSRHKKQPPHINPQREVGARCWKTE